MKKYLIFGTLSGDYVSDNVCQGGAFAPDLVESHDALTIFGREFLAEKLYWGEEVWYFDPSNATYPKLLWEM